MYRAILMVAMLATAGVASAKEVLVCETEPTANVMTPMTQETKFICPGIKEAKTLPDLYKLGWRLVQLGGNNRYEAPVAKMSLLIILEMD